jgi:hypothetical protein
MIALPVQKGFVPDSFTNKGDGKRSTQAHAMIRGPFLFH